MKDHEIKVFSGKSRTNYVIKPAGNYKKREGVIPGL